MRLYLIRHGQTWPTGPDSHAWPLSQEGIAEAEQLADAPFWNRIEALYSSSEEKALSTVRPAAERYGLEIVQDARLAEVRRPSTWIDDYEAAVRQYLEQPDHPPDGWEDRESATARILEAIRSIEERHSGRSVAVCGHGLAWTLYLLSQHPAALERVLAEQEQVLGAQAPTVESVRHLTYLEMVVKEALRLYPPAWAGSRLAAQEIEFQGYRLPPGTFVAYSQWVSHRLPDVFHEPQAFRPERFDPEHGEALPPFAYVPFGGGARLCLGMTFALLEMKVVLSALLRRWRFVLEPGQRIVPRPVVTLSPRHGIRMRVQAP